MRTKLVAVMALPITAGLFDDCVIELDAYDYPHRHQDENRW
jgi:hypothetical protein